MKLTRKQLRKIILEEVRLESIAGKTSKSVQLTEWFGEDAIKSAWGSGIEDAKVTIAGWIKDNKEDLSLGFPYGTQTVAEAAIEAKADEIANCIIDLVKPF